MYIQFGALTRLIRNAEPPVLRRHNLSKSSKCLSLVIDFEAEENQVAKKEGIRPRLNPVSIFLL